MVEPITFTVSLEDVRDSRRVQQRQLVTLAGSAFVGLGVLVWWLAGNPGGAILAVLGLLMFAEWRWPIFDRWFDRRRLSVGSVCEVWLDPAGIHWRQSRAGAFETTGQLDWSRVTGIREDGRSILVMDGRAPRVGIPKSAFISPDSLTDFRTEIRHRMASPRP